MREWLDGTESVRKHKVRKMGTLHPRQGHDGRAGPPGASRWASDSKGASSVQTANSWGWWAGERKRTNLLNQMEWKNDWYKERDEHVPHGSFSYLGLDPQFLTLFRLLGP